MESVELHFPTKTLHNPTQRRRAATPRRKQLVAAPLQKRPTMHEASTPSDPERIGFLLVSGFSAMAFFSAIEPLRVANRLAGRALYEWRVYTVDDDQVEGSNRMRL